MRPWRIVLSMMLAIAIAVLPAVGGVAAIVKAAESATASMVTADECCEHHGDPCAPLTHDRGLMDDCASLAACAAKCFGYAGAGTVGVVHVEVAVAPMAVVPSPAFAPHSEPPPFPPPRS